MNFKETWKAEWENGALHISGVTDRFPNEFSTASLVLTVASTAEQPGYEIVFHRTRNHSAAPG